MEAKKNEDTAARCLSVHCGRCPLWSGAVARGPCFQELLVFLLLLFDAAALCYRQCVGISRKVRRCTPCALNHSAEPRHNSGGMPEGPFAPARSRCFALRRAPSQLHPPTATLGNHSTQGWVTTPSPCTFQTKPQRPYTHYWATLSLARSLADLIILARRHTCNSRSSAGSAAACK